MKIKLFSHIMFYAVVLSAATTGIDNYFLSEASFFKLSNNFPNSFYHNLSIFCFFIISGIFFAGYFKYSKIVNEQLLKKRLLSEQEKLEALIMNIGSGIMVINQAYIIEYINKQVVDDFGNILGTQCFSAYMQLESPCRVCSLKKAISSYKTEQANIILKDGRNFDVTCTPFTDSDGKIKIIQVMTDVTEKKKIEAEIIRANHLASIGELAAGVAHEINNPINGIISYSEIIKDQMEDRGEKAEIPDKIIKESDRIAKIVGGLLSFSREACNEFSINTMDDILLKSLEIMEKQMANDSIYIVKKCGKDVPPVNVCGNEIQQVFMNILSNARHALNEKYPNADDNKILEVKSDVVEVNGKKNVRMIFHDNGTGISRDILNKVSNPFFSTKPVGQGTGLGLSISYGIIEKHNGRISIESVEGDFTKMAVELPAAGQEMSHAENSYN